MTLTTGLMTVELTGDGSYHGVARLVDQVTGRDLIHPRFSALNLFRLFAVHQGLGQPRLTERSVREFDRGIEVIWPPTPEHRASLRAIWEVSEPDAVDLTVTIACEGSYAGYELFCSSYFLEELRPWVWLRASRYGRAGEPEAAEWLVPTYNDVFRGTVLVFARDEHAARRCVDGRWQRDEFASPTVQMCPVRYHHAPLGVVELPGTNRGLAVMSQPADCAAISCRYHADDPADRLTPYAAFDLSLGGDDLTRGRVRTVRARLALVKLDAAMAGPQAAYQRFLGLIPRG